MSYKSHGKIRNGGGEEAPCVKQTKKAHFLHPWARMWLQGMDPCLAAKCFHRESIRVGGGRVAAVTIIFIYLKKILLHIYIYLLYTYNIINIDYIFGG